ncbi:NUDIX domain-containing protein [Neobacillus terrae]|uniref:NUDIX domain-containing protein n=1 Tax=Neobacillus terrae TaxID=3034837 RepID=UPI00140B121A|nr:NUDIX hydrolase [Neobacillus terrae]NHM31976.1 NUDIX hydrolase [Neobacillus terrae]
MNRSRACAALIKDNCILMVKEVYPDKTFWTLPGGGLEAGETFEEAVIREVKEEVNLNVKVDRLLFSYSYDAGEVRCFLVHSIDGKIATLGFDPEAGSKQTLSDVKWHTLEEMKDDLQVSKVIDSLKLLEYKFL